MAKAMYLGNANGVAAKGKKAYIGGTDGVAHQIKKMYIGDANGIARCFFGGSDSSIVYHNITTYFAPARSHLAATANKNYALFGGGYISSGISSTAVEAYNSSLTRKSPTQFGLATQDLAATSLGNYALFGGGRRIQTSGGTSTTVSNVSVYDGSLTKSMATSLAYAGSFDLSATSVGSYALFAGGRDDENESLVSCSYIFPYDTSLTRGTSMNLNKCGRYNMGATSVGSYALFAGGIYFDGSSRNYISYVDTINTSLTKGTATDLNTARGVIGISTTVGNYAMFGGSIIDIYDSSLTKSTITGSTAVSKATTLGNYAIFVSTSTAEIYDTSLTKSITNGTTIARSNGAAAAIGDYALFGGGTTSSTYTTLDVYTFG